MSARQTVDMPVWRQVARSVLMVERAVVVLHAIVVGDEIEHVHQPRRVGESPDGPGGDEQRRLPLPVSTRIDLSDAQR